MSCSSLQLQLLFQFALQTVGLTSCDWRYASAEGFGAGTQYPDGTFEGRDGLWKPDFAEGGSNLREAQNLTNHLLSEIRASKHKT